DTRQEPLGDLVGGDPAGGGRRAGAVSGAVGASGGVEALVDEALAVLAPLGLVAGLAESPVQGSRLVWQLCHAGEASQDAAAQIGWCDACAAEVPGDLRQF